MPTSFVEVCITYPDQVYIIYSHFYIYMLHRVAKCFVSDLSTRLPIQHVHFPAGNAFASAKFLQILQNAFILTITNSA